MDGALIVFIVIGLPVICLTILFLAKIIIRQGNEKKKNNQNEDEAVIEEIYHGLRDLRRRVENLETILHSQDRG
ncbi:MAG: phage-shock protein [Spirochaetota bacterium]